MISAWWLVAVALFAAFGIAWLALSIADHSARIDQIDDDEDRHNREVLERLHAAEDWIRYFGDQARHGELPEPYVAEGWDAPREIEVVDLDDDEGWQQCVDWHAGYEAGRAREAKVPPKPGGKSAKTSPEGLGGTEDEPSASVTDAEPNFVVDVAVVDDDREPDPATVPIPVAPATVPDMKAAAKVAPLAALSLDEMYAEAMASIDAIGKGEA